MQSKILVIGGLAAAGILAALSASGKVPSLSLSKGNRRTIAADFIKAEEGFRATPYADGSGVSIGYGTNYPNAAQAPRSVTQAQAETLLLAEVDRLFGVIDSKISKIGPNAAAMLVSLAYNCGSGAINEFAPRFNGGWTYQQLADRWQLWCNVNGVPNQNIKNRRLRELAILKKDFA